MRCVHCSGVNPYSFKVGSINYVGLIFDFM